MTYKFFDGHNDALSRVWRNYSTDPVTAFLSGTADGHLDLPRARAGGLAGGIFATYISSPLPRGITDFHDVNEHLTPDIHTAQHEAFEMLSILLRIEEKSAGMAKICRSVKDIRKCMETGTLAMVVHIEGAEMLDANGDLLDVLYAAGLRTLGPLWSRRNVFGDGVPFRFPASPDTGNGLTAAGIQLVKYCVTKKILVDLSHMDEKGFWQVAEVSDAPLVASHSNAHALCAQSRNLTDKQLDAIRERRGLVGVNFGVRFLREDGIEDRTTTMEEIVRHVTYLVEKLGEDCVGFGSDFDGTTISSEIQDAAGLPRLAATLQAHGFDAGLLDKLCHQNWLRVLEATWGE